MQGTPSREPQPLLIFPFNGNGLEALDCLGDAFSLIGFVDDTPSKQGVSSQGFRVHTRAAFTEFPNAQVLAVPGSSTSFRGRRALIDSLAIDPERFARVVHSSARISSLATIGRNVLLMAGVVITANAIVGEHVCVLPNSVIHHDTWLGDWSLVGSNVTIAGGTRVGENCYIGGGASISNGLEIGAGSLVGLGATVIRSCAPESKLAGNPARQLL